MNTPDMFASLRPFTVQHGLGDVRAYFIETKYQAKVFGMLYGRNGENGWHMDKEEAEQMANAICAYLNGELAYSSFDKPTRQITLNLVELLKDGTIHPTQKPVKLYEWLLTNYAKKGDRILDTHLGSGSSAIAAHNLGFDFVGTELDRDYFEAALKRFNAHAAQQSLFGNEKDCVTKTVQQEALL